MKAGKIILALGWVSAALGLTSCSLPQAQPDLTRFYILTASAKENATPAGEPTKIFLRAVNVPEFLRGRMFVVRSGENQVSFIDEARWAEPLEAGLHRVIAEDLVRQGLRVVPRAGEGHAFEITVWVKSCEGIAGKGAARLAARIEVTKTGTEPAVVTHDEFVAEVAGWNGKDYGQLAAKLSEAAGELGERAAKLLPNG
jgi:uncharacterized lipoprotein YmbA